jgi:hypothetical protein
MQLIEVKSSKEIDQFHKVPFLIYKDNKNWISHLRQDVEKIFDPEKNKIFKEGGTAIRWILKNSNGELIGRVAAFINPRVTDTTKFKTGGMGFFECIENKEAAFLLFDTCKNWLEKDGMEAMDGPINFGERSMYWGCQISNFEDAPVYQMNYNPTYYASFFDDYGFGVYFNQYVFWRSVTEPAQDVFHRKYNQLKEDPTFRIADIRGIPLEKVAEDFRIVYNGAWGGHSHFKTMSPDAAQKIMKALKPIIDPEIIIFAYKNEVPIGFFVNTPELNQIFKYVNGDLNWIGKLKFIYHKWKKTPTRMLGLVFGVTKEWQGKGIEAAMIVFGEKTIGKKGQYKDTILTWVGDFNPKMIKVAENLGTTVWRSYKTFRYQFDRNLPFERAPIVSEMKENSQ